jgi:hypothetical protein
MPTYPKPDESFARLHRAARSVGEVRLLTAAGPAWWVTGSNGESVLCAEGRTQAEAWAKACAQAKALGMVR